MKFKGTKGKWHVSGLDQTFVYALNKKGTNSFSLNINNDGKTDIKEQQANALLISKAPEMLEMLQRVVSDFYEDGLKIVSITNINNIEKLINQATEI